LTAQGAGLIPIWVAVFPAVLHNLPTVAFGNGMTGFASTSATLTACSDTFLCNLLRPAFVFPAPVFPGKYAFREGISPQPPGIVEIL